MLQRRFRRYGVADFITAEVEHGPSVRNRDVHPKEDHGPSQSRSKRGQLSALLQAHERREQLDNDDACQSGEHEHEHSVRHLRPRTLDQFPPPGEEQSHESGSGKDEQHIGTHWATVGPAR